MENRKKASEKRFTQKCCENEMTMFEEDENHFHIFTFSQDENHFHIIAGETVKSGKYKKRTGCVR